MQPTLKSSAADLRRSHKRMKTEFTTAHYFAAFKKIQIAHHYLRMLQANYHAPGRTITATQMAKTWDTAVSVRPTCITVNWVG